MNLNLGDDVIAAKRHSYLPGFSTDWKKIIPFPSIEKRQQDETAWKYENGKRIEEKCVKNEGQIEKVNSLFFSSKARQEKEDRRTRSSLFFHFAQYGEFCVPAYVFCSFFHSFSNFIFNLHRMAPFLVKSLIRFSWWSSLWRFNFMAAVFPPTPPTKPYTPAKNKTAL